MSQKSKKIICNKNDHNQPKHVGRPTNMDDWLTAMENKSLIIMI